MSTNAWDSVRTWVPPDDPTFALDPDDGAWYDEAVEADVMEDSRPPPDETQRKKKSKVSKRPHVVWMNLHRQTYLDEMPEMLSLRRRVYIAARSACCQLYSVLPAVSQDIGKTLSIGSRCGPKIDLFESL
ncbi:hypothetical protein NLJ89_g11941 [Agrocybe chaxingu]|uniref:Uncharacterized protein n=1 Tax=Agrocybe chaxingu TaxID=84603 RepID=A0A9W8JN94_9AGAR|nr:hypothetical protein NLJ89_g11941 [Agrocybe chaxingu]